ncbi:MAG: GNAT family N-acetyltransferase [Acidimicrobiia bacterium]
MLSALRVADAAEMVDVLSAEELYAFIGGTAPTEAELRERYRAQVGSPSDPCEQWHNWIVRLAGGSAMGYVQATVCGEHAEVAWVIGQPWQGFGYATEATRAMLAWLTADGDVREVTAYIHPDHAISQRVASSAGLEPTGQFADGEEIWRWPPRA